MIEVEIRWWYLIIAQLVIVLFCARVLISASRFQRALELLRQAYVEDSTTISPTWHQAAGYLLHQEGIIEHHETY